MINIKLIEFLRTGCFGPVRLGMTRAEVRQHLGSPDNYGYPPDSEEAAHVWKYGDIEIHFGQGIGRAFLIWCDYFPFPGAPSSDVNLDTWLFTDGHHPTRREIEIGLSEAGIRYQFHQMEDEMPAGLSLDLDETDSRQDRVVYEESIGTGMLVLESGVEIGIGRVERHDSNLDGTAVQVVDSVITLGYQKLNYYDDA